MTRVLVLNNYPLDEVWEEVRCGEKPDHHLYGINHFASHALEVEIIPFRASRLLQGLNALALRSRFPIPLGDLDQQWSLLKRLRRGDVVYAPCQTQAHLLSYWRALGLFQAPIVCVAHHPLAGGRLQKVRGPFDRLLLRGTDAFPSLSQGVAQAINELAGSKGQGKPHPKSRAIPWGPDAAFYPTQPARGRGVVAAGRTARDFQTFGEAASQTTSPARIICLRGSEGPGFERFASNVEVTIEPSHDYMKYPELLSIYAEARALAIPLLPGESLAGLTSLMDALAMGKPVIMTRHPLIDIDIEALGIGRWVKTGDVQGWRQAIQFFEDSEDEAFEMGRRARALVDAGFNSASFADHVIEIIKGVAQRRPSAA